MAEKSERTRGTAWCLLPVVSAVIIVAAGCVMTVVLVGIKQDLHSLQMDVKRLDEEKFDKAVSILP